MGMKTKWGRAVRLSPFKLTALKPKLEDDSSAELDYAASELNVLVLSEI
jgi:hypothetical protein